MIPTPRFPSDFRNRLVPNWRSGLEMLNLPNANPSRPMKNCRITHIAATLVALVSASTAETHVVDSTSGDGEGTLRRAILESDNGDLITFSQSLSGETVDLGGRPLRIGKDLMIDARLLPSGITVDAGNGSRVFEIGPSAEVTLRGLRITGGATHEATLGTDGESGGGILNEGTLTLDRCQVFGNTAADGGAGLPGSPAQFGGNGGKGGNGGGIYNAGSLTLLACELFDNRAGEGGAGGPGCTVQPGRSRGWQYRRRWWARRRWRRDLQHGEPLDLGQHHRRERNWRCWHRGNRAPKWQSWDRRRWRRYLQLGTGDHRNFDDCAEFDLGW